MLARFKYVDRKVVYKEFVKNYHNLTANIANIPAELRHLSHKYKKLCIYDIDYH